MLFCDLRECDMFSIFHLSVAAGGVLVPRAPTQRQRRFVPTCFITAAVWERLALAPFSPLTAEAADGQSRLGFRSLRRPRDAALMLTATRTRSNNVQEHLDGSGENVFTPNGSKEVVKKRAAAAAAMSEHKSRACPSSPV